MLGLINPVIIFAIVDLPEPDSPTNPSVSPSNNSKDTEELFNNPEHEYTKELIRLMPKIESII